MSTSLINFNLSYTRWIFLEWNTKIGIQLDRESRPISVRDCFFHSANQRPVFRDYFHFQKDVNNYRKWRWEWRWRAIFVLKFNLNEKHGSILSYLVYTSRIVLLYTSASEIKLEPVETAKNDSWIWIYFLVTGVNQTTRRLIRVTSCSISWSIRLSQGLEPKNRCFCSHIG